MSRRLAILIMFVLTSVSATGCSNTMNGFGQDMQKNGEAIQRTF
jgi:predicted small secreted protein